jgi:hypothetical protein
VKFEATNQDADPEACPDHTNLRRQEALDPAGNAQQGALQRIAHLHEPEATTIVEKRPTFTALGFGPT